MKRASIVLLEISPILAAFHGVRFSLTHFFKFFTSPLISMTCKGSFIRVVVENFAPKQ